MTLELDDLAVTVGAVRVCRALSLVAAPGEFWGILGRNGVGKTSLLHTIAGLRLPDQGVVRVDGSPLTTMSRRHIAQSVGLLLQHYEDPFPGSVLETALIGRHPYLSGWQWETPEDLAKARDALRIAGLEDFESRAVDTLSGGERRRLAIATLLTQDPPMLLLDEPSNDLDLHYQIAILDHLVAAVHQRGKTVIAIIHDPNLAARYCDRLLLLFGDGEVGQGAARDLLQSETLSRLYRHPIEMIEDAHGRQAFVPGC